MGIKSALAGLASVKRQLEARAEQRANSKLRKAVTDLERMRVKLELQREMLKIKSEYNRQVILTRKTQLELKKVNRELYGPPINEKVGKYGKQFLSGVRSMTVALGGGSSGKKGKRWDPIGDIDDVL